MTTKKRRTGVAAVVGVIVVAAAAIGIGANSKTPLASTAPQAGGFFQITPSGTPFQSDAVCAAKVHQSSWEPRAVNNGPNHTTPPQPVNLGNYSQWNGTWNGTYKPRITGNFTGTTDEIFQWAACKWGWSDELIRGEAISETNWNEATYSNGQPSRNQGFGDYSSTPSDCTTLFPNTPCPTSFGILQAKWLFHPNIRPSNAAGQAFPWTTKSTAFAVDEQVAEMRGCYDGLSTYLGNTKGDVWGCVQSWFSGSWTPGGGSYAQGVKNNMNSRPWANWADQGGGTTVPTTPIPTTVPVSTIPPTTVTVPITTVPTTTTPPTTVPPTTTTTTPLPPPSDTKTLYACIKPNGYVDAGRLGGVFIRTTPPVCPTAGDVIWHWTITK